MLHIEYQKIDPSKMMTEHHFIQDKLTQEQIDDLNGETRSFLNPVRKTEYGFARLNHVTFMLGFISMNIGLNEINLENVCEWYYRINTLEKLQGTLLQGIRISFEDLVAHVGLKVNSSIDTREEYDERMIDRFGDLKWSTMLKGDPVEGSNYYDVEEEGVVEALNRYVAEYGDGLVSEAPDQEVN